MNIQSKGLTFKVGAKEILCGVDLELKPKEMLGIIGPNGSGKSTFLKCIYRVQKPTEGTILFNGKNLEEFSYRESALQLAVVAQHNSCSFEFSVLDIVLMGRSPHKKLMEADTAADYALARNALKMVELEGFEKRKFHTLSGGEQQRVILARALTQGSECLILDEPTNHLDIKYQMGIMDTIKGLDVTAMVAVHDLNIAAMYCDRLVALKKGHVLDIGTPEELLTVPFIKKLYDVDSHVWKDDKYGCVRVSYVPQYAIENRKRRQEERT